MRDGYVIGCRIIWYYRRGHSRSKEILLCNHQQLNDYKQKLPLMTSGSFFLSFSRGGYYSWREDDTETSKSDFCPHNGRGTV